MNHSDFESLPVLGAGIGLRKEHFDSLKSADLPVNWLEIVPENFMNFGGYPQAILELCANRWPIVSHGVNLSIGSLDPLNGEYLDRLKTVLAQTRALWYSDHLCFTSIGGGYFHDLLPLPFSHEAASHVIARIRKLQKIIKLPFLLENPSYYVQAPGAQMDEAEFFGKVLEGADCGMLLDVNNVYVNSRNHGFDAKEFIRKLPLHRVAQIHLAGHKDCGDVIVDTHEGPIIQPVWDLYRFTMEALGRPVSALIEWDTNIPPLETVVEEARRAQDILESFGFAAPSPGPEAGYRTSRVSPDNAALSEALRGNRRAPLAVRREAVGSL